MNGINYLKAWIVELGGARYVVSETVGSNGSRHVACSHQRIKSAGLRERVPDYYPYFLLEDSMSSPPASHLHG